MKKRIKDLVINSLITSSETLTQPKSHTDRWSEYEPSVITMTFNRKQYHNEGRPIKT